MQQLPRYKINIILQEIETNGQYFDIDEIKQSMTELVEKYSLNGDSAEFKIMLEKMGATLGIIQCKKPQV